MTTDKNLIGAAGEHLVLSRLLEQGVLASQAPRGTRKADILVNPLDGGRPILIQVKSTVEKGVRLKWHMKEKHEGIVEKDLYYCFVSLSKENSSVYIIPAKQVSKVISSAYQAWLEKPGAKGQAHNESEMRWIATNYPFTVPGVKDGWMDKYLENWAQLSS
jgi:hypothetical protein